MDVDISTWFTKNTPIFQEIKIGSSLGDLQKYFLGFYIDFPYSSPGIEEGSIIHRIICYLFPSFKHRVDPCFLNNGEGFKFFS